ncbi:MAG TPA: vanadium-dependent haloperoxidase [Candidatus Tectomicrobia bacterium]
MFGIGWHTWHTLRAIAVAILVPSTVMVWSTIARADAVTDWNAVAVQALATAAPPRPGAVVFLDLAIVQAAVHDAVQAIEGRFEPYHVDIPGASGSPAAAAAKAAHDVLVDFLPGQAATLDTTYHNYLATHGLAEDDLGVTVGQEAAAGLLALRANDGRVPNPLPPPFIGGTAPGVWRPTPSYQAGPPPSLAPMATPWLGAVPPFTLKSGDQFLAKAPPPLTSKRYAKEYNEVKALGARFNSTRTQEQTDLAYFYAGNNFILWNRALRDIAAAHTANIGDNARLLALGTLAIADAFIVAWENKIHYIFWRPVTAIQEGDDDGNARTAGNQTWEPLINTPNYPDYTSGANNAVGALTRTLELFFGTDHITFMVFSQHPLADPNTRTYHRFSDLAWDTVDVRIYQGIHFRFADEAARKQGRRVAQWAFRRFLKPID